MSEATTEMMDDIDDYIIHDEIEGDFAERPELNTETQHVQHKLQKYTDTVNIPNLLGDDIDAAWPVAGIGGETVGDPAPMPDPVTYSVNFVPAEKQSFSVSFSVV